MLDLARIQKLAATATPQDLFAMMLWQTRFNSCDGPVILTDLVEHPHLWKSFTFSRPIYGPDPRGLGFLGMVDILMAMAIYCTVPDDSPIHWISYPADTLFILAKKQDVIVSQLLDLGKKWQADEVAIYSAHEKPENAEDKDACRFSEFLGYNLKRIWLNAFDQEIEGVLIRYWWD